MSTATRIPPEAVIAARQAVGQTIITMWTKHAKAPGVQLLAFLGLRDDPKVLETPMALALLIKEQPDARDALMVEAKKIWEMSSVQGLSNAMDLSGKLDGWRLVIITDQKIPDPKMALILASAAKTAEDNFPIS